METKTKKISLQQYERALEIVKKYRSQQIEDVPITDDTLIYNLLSVRAINALDGGLWGKPINEDFARRKLKEWKISDLNKLTRKDLLGTRSKKGGICNARLKKYKWKNLI